MMKNLERLKAGSSVFSICVTKVGMKFESPKGRYILTDMIFDDNGNLVQWEFMEVGEPKRIKAVDLEKAINQGKITVL